MSDIKFTETGSPPYHLNMGSTAKNFSSMENTCPQNNLMFVMNKTTMVQDNTVIIDIIIEPSL